MMTSFQFLCQYFLARMCLDIGIIKRNSTRVGNRTWEEYARTGAVADFSLLRYPLILLHFAAANGST